MNEIYTYFVAPICFIGGGILLLFLANHFKQETGIDIGKSDLGTVSRLKTRFLKMYSKLLFLSSCCCFLISLILILYSIVDVLALHRRDWF